MFKDQAVPLYYQLETLLRKKILAGELEPGATLPILDSLAKEYEVSRITVRQALSALERDGLIVRKRGKGTFVSENPASLKLPKLTGSVDDLIARGMEIQTKVLDFRWIDAPGNVADCLGLPKRTSVLRIERLRFVKGSPLSYIVNYLPRDIGQRIQRDDLLVKPLLKILNDDLGIKLAKANQKIEADIADTYVAPLLDVRVGDPLLKIERTAFDQNQRVVEWVSIWYRADRYFYRVWWDGRRGGSASHLEHI